MLDAARRWLHEAELLELTLGVLRCLGSFAPACMESFAQQGGPHLVLDAMARHGGHALLQVKLRVRLRLRLGRRLSVRMLAAASACGALSSSRMGAGRRSSAARSCVTWGGAGEM